MDTKRTDHRSLAGLILFSLVFLSGFANKGNVGLYFNISGLLIVIGGVMGAILICYPLDRLLIVYKVLRQSFHRPQKDAADIVEILVDLSVKSRFKGLLSLQQDEEETSLMALRNALGYLVDGHNEQQLRDILGTEMYFFRMRRDDSERILRTMADLFPSFGIIGSVVGLIGMIAGVGDTAVILSTVPIALTSTLYGIIFANFIFTPFAVRLHDRTNQELLLQKIIMEGVIAIGSEMNPRLLEIKLKSFLTPSSRAGRLVSLQKIQQRFKIKPENEPSAPEPVSP
ncbi:MAG: MotA/TolQ/ExbB proton channel family protein [Proteobacteria bacterium]|nr:MotA/TolQ/ExbB proton channel family protein [Pseudomonadota bacterium]MBU1688706.1 MotA/TolQ/ExbB proton channel family protein [Pseudomonadota bacterium]